MKLFLKILAGGAALFVLFFVGIWAFAKLGSGSSAAAPPPASGTTGSIYIDGLGALDFSNW